MIECGKSVDVKDMNGAFAVRFIAQCGGRFLTISNHWPTSPRNGYMLSDWRGVARELVALSVPKPMEYERGMRAQSTVANMYCDLPLTYPLSIKGMADLFGEDVEAVRDLLADLAVQSE